MAVSANKTFTDVDLSGYVSLINNVALDKFSQQELLDCSVFFYEIEELNSNEAAFDDIGLSNFDDESSTNRLMHTNSLELEVLQGKTLRITPNN